MNSRLRCIFLFALTVALVGTPYSIWAAATSPATTITLPAWTLAKTNPTELMRQAAQNETANSYGKRPPIRYELRKTEKKVDTTKEIVETADGGVARLIAVNDHPLNSTQEEQENIRLNALLNDPAIEEHRYRGEIRDAKRIRKFTRLLPQAFLYQFVGPQNSANGNLIRLHFSPNPKFTPPDFESHILSGIQGELWIDPAEIRIVHVEAKLFRVVDYGWGIIGSVYPGGTLRIDQKKTPACGWQLSRLSLHMNGKALLMKSIKIDVEEYAGAYADVPQHWSYKQAVQWLLQKYPPGGHTGGDSNALSPVPQGR